MLDIEKKIVRNLAEFFGVTFSRTEKFKNTDYNSNLLIVPFTYDEFIKRKITQEGVENKLREYFYSRDLFAIESPIRNDSYFFGRKK
ncbi:hypothetical protein [Paenibacillus sp.]|jgi:hypothetical protein|uniref:hypothetical protein n=1 Tax=Paenibacillus sp. TaxID=58172 RepID=UPI002839CC47|nr:hypothetical protein [Paenibacillus sp.]MDR0269340.1 hypothetical protein [Paenibacillus sp.]